MIELEQPEGVIVQFGGQTPLRLAAGLERAGVRLLGTSVDAIDTAEDRGRFGELLARLGYQAPPYATANTIEQAHLLVHECLEPQAHHQRCRHDQPSIGHQCRVIEGHSNAVGPARY